MSEEKADLLVPPLPDEYRSPGFLRVEHGMNLARFSVGVTRQPRAAPLRPIPLRKTACIGGHVARLPRPERATLSSGAPLLYSK